MKKLYIPLLLVLTLNSLSAQVPIATTSGKLSVKTNKKTKHYARKWSTRPVMIKGAMETVTFGTEPRVVVKRAIDDLDPIKYGEHNYYLDQNGDFFRYNGGRYLLVKPPNGLVIKQLPKDSFHLYVKGKWFDFRNGIFYKAVDSGFEVVAAPLDAIIYDLPLLTDVVMIKDSAYYEYLGVLYEKVMVDEEQGFQVVGELTE
ncbi:hypothetical protein K8352_10810 [Flavobacteriaceae bacterium F89]|uniref:WG repeat-containing protein n=1 Tax=Cerina litoralis TaxID=2874477 RepID=A0AAE3EUA3_9FLAO|nr:DUF6515 family protein [Cerina litoralis]MCG2461240.1 hypothetical protein [Cerina litoralis]